MNTNTRMLYAGLGVALTLSVTGCAGKSADNSADSTEPSPSASSAPAASEPPSPTASPSPTAPAVDQTIRITYANGKVVGGAQLVKVKLGSTVSLVVTSDVADEVHFHGYDKHADVTKGGTVTITFKASIPGRFIAELEKLGRRLVTLQIQ